VPPHVDWDAWLGPAPEAPYNPGVIRGWNSMWGYAGGSWGGDGIHQLDLARMALADPPPPKAAYCAAGHFAYPEDAGDAPDMQAVTYDFGAFTMVCESGHFSPYMKKFPPEVRFGKTWPLWPQSSCRIEIYGTNQLMYLGRHGAGWQVLEADGKRVAEEKGHFPDKDHQTNFIECIRSRKLPHGDIEQGHQSASVVHMGNIAHRIGNQRVAFDAATESCPGNAAANSMLRSAYRKHYRIPDSV
jgi:predicted dehydrogenase